MLVQEVAQKYAYALFLSAKERQLIDVAYDQLGSLSKMVASDNSLLTFLGSPQISEEQKLSLIRSVFGERIEALFVEFLVVLVRKRRAKYLPEVLDEFNRLVEFEKGIARVTVFTAVPLSSDDETKLTSRLATKTGEKIELEKKVDPKLLGGMIVIMHDQIIDGSTRHGLDELEEQLQKVKVH